MQLSFGIEIREFLASFSRRIYLKGLHVRATQSLQQPAGLIR